MMDIIGTSENVFCMEVSLIQGLSNTVMYYSGMRTSVVNREVSFVQRVFNTEVPLYIHIPASVSFAVQPSSLR